jgi:glycosyltransferase involved in cell wall biosynthesis
LIKISVLIPIYGTEAYIGRCSRSLFEQTIKDNIEFIFRNDCTKDKSMEILQSVINEYPERKKQIKIFNNDKNYGRAFTYNYLLKDATGEYIIYCDSDDWVEHNMYQLMYEKASADNSDMVCSGYYFEKKNNKKSINFKINKVYEKQKIQTKFQRDSNLYNVLWNKLIKRDLIKKRNINFYLDTGSCIDISFTFQIWFYSHSISIIKEPLYHYNICPERHSDNYSIKKKEEISDIILLTKYMSEFYSTNHVSNKYKYIIYSKNLFQKETAFPVLYKGISICGKLYILRQKSIFSNIRGIPLNSAFIFILQQKDIFLLLYGCLIMEE